MTRDHAAADAPANALLDELGVSPHSNLIAVLQQVQKRLGYLPRPVLEEISRRTGTRLSRIYGVLTFYSQFYTAPRGRHTIRCCDGTVCHIKGAPLVLDEVERVLGIREGQSTPDGIFFLETIACMGMCSLSPVMMIDDRYYVRLTPCDIEGILQTYRLREPCSD